jgi:membrane-bound lytic murein transglycosylase D
MRSTLQAIMRSRVTPWLLFVVTLTTTAGVVVQSHRNALVSPALQELSARIHRQGRDYVRGLELIVSGDTIMGGNLLASATDQMSGLAEECVRVDDCDIDIFTRALRTTIEEQHAARNDGRWTSEASLLSRWLRPDEPLEPAPTALAAPTAGEPPAPAPGLDLEQAIVLNGPVKRALDDWLTWNRPQLAEAYENYLFLREQLAPIYAKAGLPEALLFGVMTQETGGKVHAYSSAGAAGPLQFMPATGRRYGLGPVNGFDMRLDPVAATKASAEYLIELLGRFDRDLPSALAAYNAGENRLATLHRRVRGVSFWDAKLSAALPIETRNYVPGVLAAAWIFLHAEDYGFVSSPLDGGTTVITLAEPVSIGELTICLGPEQNRNGWFRTLRNLNPRMSGDERIDAGETLRMPSMLVRLYVERCAGSAPPMARARELHDATDETPGGIDYARQDDGT